VVPELHSSRELVSVEYALVDLPLEAPPFSRGSVPVEDHARRIVIEIVAPIVEAIVVDPSEDVQLRSELVLVLEKDVAVLVE
jgi:hypothetical protein